MRAVVQRVKKATLYSEGVKHSEIEHGMLIFFGVHETDTEQMLPKFAQKLKNLRIFEDENGKTNLNLEQTGGEMMVVSNFTLYGRTKGTNRPDFTHAGKPEMAEKIYDKLCEMLSETKPVKTGVFGTDMQIELIADGPCNYIVEEYSTKDAIY